MYYLPKHHAKALNFSILLILIVQFFIYLPSLVILVLLYFFNLINLNIFLNLLNFKNF